MYCNKVTQKDIVMDKKMISICESNKSVEEYLKIQESEDIMVLLPVESNNIEDVLPAKFNNLMHSSVGSRNYQHLEQLLYLYIPNISSLAMSNIKFNDAVNLKNHVNNMLIFFYLYWFDIKQDIADHSSYLNKMSALLNVYIDMELKTSIHVKELPIKKRTSTCSSKIAAKILTALYIYLNNSEEHIFRVLLRIKHTTEKYTKIYNYIFTKSFTFLKTKTTSITDVAYVRYLLAFKIWEKMEDISKKRERIYRLAITVLGPRMPDLRNELLEFIPKPPADQENQTLWLLQSNVFDLKQAHEHFLLFEDKTINLDLQYSETVHTNLSSSRLQKSQTTSLFHQNNGNKGVNQEINKDCSSSMQNRNTISNNNENKCLAQTYLQRKGMKSSKSLKNMKKKAGKTIITDLIGGEEVRIPCKVKRKKTTTRNLEFLKIKKSIIKNKKHINLLTRTSSADIKKQSNKESKNSAEKVPMDCKPVSEAKVNDSIESCTLSRDSSNDVNFQKNNYLNTTRNQLLSNICPKSVKDDEKQRGYSSNYVKPSVFDQNTEGLKVTTNAVKENKAESYASHSTYMTGSAVSSYNDPMPQNKETLTSREESTTETTTFKMCQSSIADQHSLKQELPTSTDCSVTHKCFETMPVDEHDIKHLIKNLKSINNHSSQLTEMIEQKVCHQVNECLNCCAKIDRKPFLFTNIDVTESKAQETQYNALSEDENDVKLACNMNIIYMLNSDGKCVYVVNHIGERVMAVHAEKRMHYLDKSNDTCTVSTTFTGDQIVESPLYSHHVNLGNATINDYNTAKYSEIIVKEQKESDCDSSTLNDKLQPSKICAFDINSSEISSNVEVDYELKTPSKIEETDKTMKTGSIDDLAHVSFLNNIQGETFGDFPHQPSAVSQINFDNLISTSTKKPRMFTDRDITGVKTQDTSHMFGEHGVESLCDTNISDGNEYVYVVNYTGEHVSTNTEERIQCTNNSNMCDVSTTVIGDNITESSLDGHVVSDNRKSYDSIDDFDYFEATMKEQHKTDCDTSITNNHLHSYELYTYDSDSFDINSKEANEIMNTDCIDGFENISFSHDIPIEKLEDILSSTDFSPPLKQFELDSLYTDTVADDRDILCNTQNHAVDSSVDPITFCLNNDNTFLRLSVKSDKSMLQKTVEES